MLRKNRAYRAIRAGLVILGATLRYFWLRIREKTPWKPSQAAWDRAHGRTGRAIYKLATRMGGAFVKLGQILGARADALPESLIAPLRSLHDRVPPRLFSTLEEHVEHELGRPITEVFASVDEQPIAAASLAQVHRATLATGEDVVIKVQYPEARKLFPVDFASLRRAVRVARWFNRRLDLRPLVDELAEFVCLELEFLREASSTERVRGLFANTAGVRIPHIHISKDRLLVLEFLEGTALTKLDELDKRGVDRRKTAESIAKIYCEMIFTHGFFHGDPHPGNLLVAPDGTTINVLDFGLAKELPPGFADGAAAMIVHGLAGDIDSVIAAASSIGFEVSGDRSAFGDLVKMLMGNHAEVAGDAISVISASNIKKIPSHFALIGRTFILLNGISHMLVPGERVIAQTVARVLGPRLMKAAAAKAANTPAATGM